MSAYRIISAERANGIPVSLACELIYLTVGNAAPAWTRTRNWTTALLAFKATSVADCLTLQADHHPLTRLESLLHPDTSASCVKRQEPEYVVPLMNPRMSRRCGPALLVLWLAVLIAPWAVGQASARHRRHGHPVARTKPTITGTAAVGHLLHASSGRWTGASRFRYRWQRCDSRGARCKAIGIQRGHRSNAYAPTRREVGHKLRVTVIASNAWGSAASTSPPTRAIRDPRPPVNLPTPPPGGEPVSTPPPRGEPVPTPPPGGPSGSGGLNRITAYVTGYDHYDNTPPGSVIISNPVLHRVAGGTGTYQDPITVAVGHSIINGRDILDWPSATRFYIPNLRRYFIVEDTCGDGPTPQNEPCHDLSQADPGAQTWLDVWVDGGQMSSSAANSCKDAITRNQLAIRDPARNYAVVPGAIAGSSCTQQYGDTAVLAGG